MRSAEYAKQQGERLLLVTKNPTWERDIADVVVSVDVSDVEATVAAVRVLAVGEDEPIRAVVAFREHSVPAAASVAADLGLSFVGEDVARIARDKYVMRKTLEAEGIPQPMYGLARTVDEAIEQADRIGFPVVVKPVVNNDTSYIRRVADIDELRRCFPSLQYGAWHVKGNASLYNWARHDYGNAVIIEEFLPGLDVSVESIVTDGQTHVVAIHDKPNPEEGPYLVDVRYTTPSKLPMDTQLCIHHLTGEANRAVGINTGATHTELRVREDGTAKILEIAARLGGGPIYQSVLLSTGVDMVDAVLDTARGRQPTLQARSQPVPTGFHLFFAERAGLITAIDGVEETRLDPRVHELALYHGVGDTVELPPQVWQSHGHVVYTADDADELDDMFGELDESLTIAVQ